jgi:recombination protein RecA
MSSAVVSTSAAQGRPFVFEVEDGGEACPRPSGADLNQARPPQREVPAVFTGALKDKDARLASVTPASRLAVRPALEMVSCGIAEMDALTGGFPRSCLTEICGPASSGRSTLLLSALAAATRRGEFCAVVDASDALDPQSVVAAGVELDRLLWVRCGENLPRRHRDTEKKNLKGRQISKFDEGESRHAEYGLEQLLRATDLLLESGGFGLIALDLGDLPPQTARRIPLTTWFRFRRAVEHTPTVLLAIERQSIAGSCSSLLIKLGSMKSALSGESQFQLPVHAQLLTDLEITAELVRSTLDRNLDRKPVRSAEIRFASKTAWAE